MSARIISVTNQKGGVGKTTTVVNLAHALSKRSKRVLVLDMDPQGNASTILGDENANSKYSIYDVLRNSKKIVSTCTTKTRYKLIDLVYGNIKSAAAERELYGSVSTVMPLKMKMDEVAISEYDYILIDCPPSLGLLTLNALVASHSIIVPLEADSYLSLLGIDALTATITDIRENLNRSLRLLGVLITMYDSRTSICKAMAQEITDYFSESNVFKTIINRNTAINQAMLERKTIFEYDRRAYGARDYYNLAKELLDEQNSADEEFPTEEDDDIRDIGNN